MKKNIKKTILIALMAFFVTFMQSCSKDTEGTSIKDSYNFNVFVENGNPTMKINTGIHLYIPTVSDYENCIEYLISCDEDDLDDFEEDHQFISMRNTIKGQSALSEDIEEMNDDVLGTFLNPNGFVRIGDTIYKIDVENSTTYYLDLTNDPEGSFQEYKEEPEEGDSKCSCDDGTSVGIAHQHCIFNAGTTYEVLAFISYRNLVVYHSLVAVIKDASGTTFRADKTMDVFAGYYDLQGKPDRHYFSAYNEYSSDRKIHKTVACSGFRKMRNYYLKVKFTIESTSYYDNQSFTLTIPPTVDRIEL